MRKRIRRWLFWKTQDWDNLVCAHDWPEWSFVPERVESLFCAILLSHEPTMDHCGKPEHDFCAWCQKSMPNQAPRP